ncbi:hypothetical protein GOBAR_AA36314 [Gossypium barbadense]|uniref:Uncharacterized protein n=1 Tax=Gossypium barbadense TaxID=3634 RepID=A0A2P5VZX8_GOSBA|nr:hypothetical protein GOBAR_AA36314 [Gossypium barbadense]
MRPRRASRNPRSGATVKVGPSSTPMQEKAPMAAPNPVSGPYSQPPVHKTDKTQWQPKSTPQSTIDEDEKEKGSKPQHVSKGEGDD